MLKNAGVYEFLPNPEAVTGINRQLCKIRSLSEAVCGNVLFLISGYDSQQLNKVVKQ